MSKHTPSRRRYIQGMSTASLLALAGCSGSSDESTTSTSGTTTDAGTTQSNGTETTAREDLPMVDRTYRIAHGQDTKAKDLSLNMSKWRSFPWGVRHLLWSQGGYRELYSQEWNGILFEDVTVNPSSVTVTVKENANWSNGEPITGKHVRNHVLDSIMSRAEKPRKEAIQKPGDTGSPMLAIRPPTDSGSFPEDAIEVDGKSATFKTLEGFFGERSIWKKQKIENEFWKANPPLTVYDDIYQQFWELDDPFGADYETTKKLDKKLGEMEVGWEDTPTHGPFYLADAVGHKRVLKRNEGHPFAEDINWKKIVAEYFEGSRAQRTAVVQDHLDSWDGSMPARTLESLPDNIKEFRHPVPWGDAINVNVRDATQFGDVRVRQAVQHVIDREALTEAVSGETVIEATAIDIPGVMGATPDVVSDSFKSKLNPYETDHEKAASLLREAGFKKKGGTWQTPEGKEWSFKFQTDSSVPHFETLVVQQLNRFGINAELYTMDSAIFEETVNSGKHTMVKGGWGGDQPEETVGFFWWIPQNPGQRGRHGIWTDEQVKQWGKQNEDVNIDENGYAHNFTAEDLRDTFVIEAPPVGKPDGELREYDTAAIAFILDQGHKVPNKTYKEALKELIWVYNWFVPEMPIYGMKSQKFHDTKNWLVPSEDKGTQWFRGPKELINSGHIHADPDA